MNREAQCSRGCMHSQEILGHLRWGVVGTEVKGFSHSTLH